MFAPCICKGIHNIYREVRTLSRSCTVKASAESVCVRAPRGRVDVNLFDGHSFIDELVRAPRGRVDVNDRLNGLLLHRLIRAPRGRVDVNTVNDSTVFSALVRAPRGRVDVNSNPTQYIATTRFAPLAGAWMSTFGCAIG